MRVRTAPSYRRRPKQYQVIRPPVAISRTLAPSEERAPQHAAPLTNPDAAFGFQTDPYLDYGRTLTNAGGIRINYKDIDTRWRYLIWRVVALTSSTGSEAWFAYTRSPVESTWINLLCLLAVAAINWLIVWRAVEVYRQIEVRPDCLIIEDEDVFWCQFMEGGWPGFQPNEDGHQVLCGIYGTRFVEYLTVRRFDEYDRAPEVFAAHLEDAINQLWARPE